MKRLLLPALLALAASGCSHVIANAAPSSHDEAAKCQLVRTLMHERVPQQLLEGVSHGQDVAAQVVVYVHRPEEEVLERLFAGDEPACEGPGFRVMRESTREAVVLFLQPKAQGAGYTYSAQRAAPGQLALGGKAKGSVTPLDDGGWVASDVP